MKWVSVEEMLKKNVVNEHILYNCLSKQQAEKILFQTFIQFERGL
jgi:hypothetical protein